MSKAVPVTMTFPCLLLQVRKAYKWSAAEVAEALYMPRTTYIGIESGYSLPAPAIVFRLCDLFGCKPMDLWEPYILATIGLLDKKDVIKEGMFWKDGEYFRHKARRE